MKELDLETYNKFLGKNVVVKNTFLSDYKEYKKGDRITFIEFGECGKVSLSYPEEDDYPDSDYLGTIVSICSKRHTTPWWVPFLDELFTISSEQLELDFS